MPRLSFLDLVPIGMLALATLALGQGSSGVAFDPAAQSQPAIDPLEESAQGSSRRAGSAPEPIFAPVPFKNTQVGWGLAVMAGIAQQYPMHLRVDFAWGLDESLLYFSVGEAF